jgi:hypothetical protein
MLSDAIEYSQSGQHLKAIETLSPAWISSGIRAFREFDEGVTDRAGRRRKDEHDEYIKPDTLDTIVRLAGFNPVSISERTDRVWSEKKIKESYAEMRRDILGRYRDMVNDGNPSQDELADLALEIEAYNARVRRSGRNIPYIDDVSLRNALTDTENKFFTAGLDEKAQRRRENKGNKKLVIRNGRIVRE